MYVKHQHPLFNFLALLQIPSSPEFRSHVILKGIIKEKKIHMRYNLWYMTSVNV